VVLLLFLALAACGATAPTIDDDNDRDSGPARFGPLPAKPLAPFAPMAPDVPEKGQGRP